ncbi:MAG: DUF5695 domain-containing protein, partial [Gemmatimonadales bacterium]
MSALATALLTILIASHVQAAPQTQTDSLPTLGLEQGVDRYTTPSFALELVRASQTVAALQPKGAGGFDFTPNDWLERRSRNGFYHLGDLRLRLRIGGSSDWQQYSTAATRTPVRPLTGSGPVLAAADLTPTFPPDVPLDVRRYWEVDDG